MKSHWCRLATTADLDELVRLRVLMQKEVNAATDDAFDPAYRDDVRKYFARAILDGTYVSAVAEAEGRLVAATGLVIFEKPPSLRGRNGRIGYFTNVFTETGSRGLGLATKLMELSIAEAKRRGVDNLQLGSQPGAVGVYERVGFRPTRLPQLELKL
ncbi:MAG: GNAT family N-acetyltransferase [Deltaproteobacteria bacterium]|nr:GNAT family N-acetyltransferase [Deltaproteobacteria bacterium]